MRTIHYWCAAGFALLTACGGGGEAGDDLMQDTATAAVPPAAVDTGMGADTGMQGAGMTHVGLNAVGGSSASGMAMVTPRGTDLEVQVSVTGAPANASLPAHIHRGRCGNDGGVAAPLTAIAVGADGSGSSTTTVPQSSVSGEHFVQVHGDGGAPILCGDVPAPPAG